MKHVASLADCDVIVMCGLPLTGKTYLTRLIQSYRPHTRLSENLHLHQSMIFLNYAIQCGNTVIIDQLNLTESLRAKWIKLAREKNLSIGLLILDSTPELIEIRKQQQLKIIGEQLRSNIDSIIMNCTARYEYPNLRELDLYDIVLTLDARNMPANVLELERVILPIEDTNGKKITTG